MFSLTIIHLMIMPVFSLSFRMSPGLIPFPACFFRPHLPPYEVQGLDAVGSLVNWGDLDEKSHAGILREYPALDRSGERTSAWSFL